MYNFIHLKNSVEKKIHSEIASKIHKQLQRNSIELNMKFWRRKTEIEFSCKIYSINLCFIYNFGGKFLSVQ